MLAYVRSGPLRGLTGQVRWTGGLLGERAATVGSVTVPHLQRMFEDSSVSHVVENFRIAAGEAEGAFSGTVFGDGDFYKWMEAALWTAQASGDAQRLEQLDAYIALIGRAQRSDGYLSTKQIIGEIRGENVTRQGDINDFEVYNMGHLFTAACLHKRLTGKDSFLHIARKAAGYLGEMYRVAEEKGEVKTAVCPSHYMGLVELYRTTGRKEYLDLARRAIALRDSVRCGLDDNQDRLPLREHREIIGHAVRANYLYAGLADLCLEEEHGDYRDVLHAVWDDLVERKMYITGGCGALYNGASPYGNFFRHQLVHQAYGYPYQLPNITAYNETCAAVGGVMWAYRMFLLEGSAGFMDTLERMLLNTCLAGISLDGKRFFYENMLRRVMRLPFKLLWGQERSAYIESFCCPPNLARLLAQSAEYAYVSGDDVVYTGLYGASEAEFTLPCGTRAVLVQETDYPYDGKITFRLKAWNGVPFTLALRIPAWADAQLTTQKGMEHIPPRTYHRVKVTGERVCELDLGMKPRLTCANSLVEEDANQVCLEVGPLVYCLEGADAPCSVSDCLVPRKAVFTRQMTQIGGRTVPAYAATVLRRKAGTGGLYAPLEDTDPEEVPVRLIPYFAWDNRGMGEMRVWLPLAWGRA